MAHTSDGDAVNQQDTTSPAVLMGKWQQATMNVLYRLDWENDAWADEFRQSLDDVERYLTAWALGQPDPRRISTCIRFLSTVLDLVANDLDEEAKR